MAEHRSAHAILTAARARIADPAAWTQKVYARTAAGCPTTPLDPEARCWCAYGALAADGGCEYGLEGALLGRAAIDLGEPGVLSVNDEVDHTAVLAMYDRAIALASAEEAR